jgi:two-component system response regulator GlrR
MAVRGRRGDGASVRGATGRGRRARPQPDVSARLPAVSDRAEETAAVPRAPRSGPLGALLRIEGAHAVPRSIRSPAGKIVIGAAPDADVLIEDPTVSRRHVELEVVPEGVAVRDLGSRNGTFVLGHRVDRITLSFGSRVTVGAATVIVELDAESLKSGDPVEPRGEYRGLVGASRSMQRLFSLMSRLEGSLVSVLIEGESGVGKELIARGLHDGSSRADRPFVVFNCGAVARELLLSDLFGHKRGAFTGAVDVRRGAFEEADGGTLFLDELGELPLDAQPALLRALESGEIRAVGETTPRHVSVRVVAATNRDLSELVRLGRFREDLFYRIAVVRLAVPPLRSRPEDIEALARRFAAQNGGADLPSDVVAGWHDRPWPGNVRELRNAVLAYLALGSTDAMGPTDDALEAALARAVDLEKSYGDQKDALIEKFTRVYFRRLLDHTGGNQSSAAKIAGLDRGHLGRIIQRLGVDKPRS